jgi:hypothetical protein
LAAPAGSDMVDKRCVKRRFNSRPAASSRIFWPPETSIKKSDEVELWSDPRTERKSSDPIQICNEPLQLKMEDGGMMLNIISDGPARVEKTVCSFCFQFSNSEVCADHELILCAGSFQETTLGRSTSEKEDRRWQTSSAVQEIRQQS